MSCDHGFDSPFCPQCGATARDPLRALLAQCRQTARTQAALAGKAEERHPRMIDGHRKSSEKWQAWADALGKLMNNKDHTEE